jgi:hypothetical protein
MATANHCANEYSAGGGPPIVGIVKVRRPGPRMGAAVVFSSDMTLRE